MKFVLNANSRDVLNDTLVLGYFEPRYCGIKAAVSFVYKDPRLLGLAMEPFFNSDDFRFEEYEGYTFLIITNKRYVTNLPEDYLSHILAMMVKNITYASNLCIKDWESHSFVDVVDQKNFLHHVCYLRGVQNLQDISMDYMETEFGLRDLFTRAYVGAYNEASGLPSAKRIFSIWEDLKAWKKIVGD